MEASGSILSVTGLWYQPGFISLVGDWERPDLPVAYLQGAPGYLGKGRRLDSPWMPSCLSRWLSVICSSPLIECNSFTAEAVSPLSTVVFLMPEHSAQGIRSAGVNAC